MIFDVDANTIQFALDELNINHVPNKYFINCILEIEVEK